MNNFLLVFLGGGIGSVLRFAMSLWIGKNSNTSFPWNTFSINLLASFILGLLAGLILLREGEYETQRLLIGVGFCGGLSTFSTFTLEVFDLIKSGNIIAAFMYIFASVVVCLLAFWIAQLILKSF